MKKFEYKLIASYSRELNESNLNNYGKKGWELIAVTANETNLIYTYYFKREIS